MTGTQSNFPDFYILLWPIMASIRLEQVKTRKATKDWKTEPTADGEIALKCKKFDPESEREKEKERW